MALDSNRMIEEAGFDQVTSNQRTRAYRKGTTYGDVSDSNANPNGVMIMNGTMVATNFTTGSQTLTATILGSGIVVGSPAAAATYTLDTATNIINYMNNNSAGVQVGDVLQCLLINAGNTSGVITVNPGSGGGFDTGQNNNLQLPINTSRVLNIRITNTVTPAYIVYG